MKGVKNVVFFNTWHNGDCFVGKEYIKILIEKLKQLGEFNFFMFHHQREKILWDLDAKHVNGDLPEGVDTLDIVKIVGDTLFINTWIGVFTPLFTKTQQHCNYPTLSVTWKIIFYLVEKELGLKFNLLNRQERTNPADGIPSTDWSKYDIAAANEFVSGKNKIVLFCNSDVASFQNHFSGIGNLENVISNLAFRHQDTTFVCTQKAEISNPGNVFFTDDIFSKVTGGDLNEIGYLSRFCKLIIGKNSGPYVFSQVKDNVFREDCIFYSISDRQSDSLLYNVFDIKCSHYFFVGKEERNILFTIDAILSNSNYLNFAQHSLITDDRIIAVPVIRDIKNFGDVELNWF